MIDIYSKGNQPVLTLEMFEKAVEQMRNEKPKPRVRYISMDMYKEYQEIGPDAFFEKYPWMY